MPASPQPVIDFDTLVSGISQAFTVPAVSAGIIQLIQDPASSIADLESLIKSDSPLSTSLLRVANSPCFHLNQPVTDIHKAIALLGLGTVRDLALAASVCSLFRSNHPIGEYTRTGLWKHSAAVAIASRMIARRVDHALDEALFTVGILHDIGLLLMDRYAHEHFVKLMNSQETLPLEVQTRNLMGKTHHELAQKVLTQWKLPETITTTIACQWHPLQAKEYQQQCSIFYLANILVNSAGIGYVAGRGIHPEDFNHALKVLGLTTKDVQVFLDDIHSEVEAGSSIVELVQEC